MFPVLLTIDKISISSFGVFLALGLFIGLFLIWRLARAWDLHEERVLDLTFISFMGGLIGARLYFCLENIELFLTKPLTILLFNKVPGFSFWGAIIGSSLTLLFFAKRMKLNFWMVADIASVGFIGGLVLTNLGCFLGGCDVGIVSKLFLAVNMVGEVGRRFPVQILEALLFLIILKHLWVQTTHFHQPGKILSLALIYTGLIKLLMEPFKVNHDEGVYLSGGLIILGINILYKITKRNLILDLKSFGRFLIGLFTSSDTRKHTLASLNKYLYNQKTSVSWGFRNLKKSFSLKKVLRRLNVRFSHKNDKLYQK